MTIAKMFDCSTHLNPQSAQDLKAQGYCVAGRYLGAQTHGWSKAITSDEVQVLKGAGIMIISFWESDPTYPEYFTPAQGTQDAQQAVQEAQAIGQPQGSAIYLTVDFDAQDNHMEAIRQYLAAAVPILYANGYKLGVYGSYRVMSNVSADFYMQTVAWSHGQISPRACIIQYAPSHVVAGVDIDDCDVISGPAWWNQPVPKPTPQPLPVQQNTIATDVADSDWFAAAVKYVKDDLKIMTNYPDGSFNPNGQVTRAMLAQVLYNMFAKRK